MNAQQIYQNILQTRGFRELAYQSDFLTNKIYQKPKLPLVLAAGTSSGKTFMAIMRLEIFYSNPANKNKRTILIPASKTVLRDNVSKELMDFNPSFSYCVVTDKTELNQAIKNKCNVIICLPQTILNSLDLLPHFHNFILDEAHQWYFKSTIQSILTKTKPKYQLLLTGSPSRFIAKEDKFIFKFVPVMELYELGQVTNVKMEVVTSSYDFKQDDYTSSYGNLKPEVEMTDKQSNTALMNVCKEMVKKLKNPIKGLHNVNRLTKNLFSVFGEMEKTIIFCHSLKQADSFYKSLSSFKGLKGKVLVSHSENDKDSQLFEDFRTKDDYSVLIAVDRGRLGFNIPELFNVVDFTMTQSLDMLLQMYGRLLRLSKTDKQKIYYKVATKNTAPYFVDLMTAMLCLTNMEWYSKFNGKNMGGILIPKVLSKTNRNSVSTTTTKKSKSVKPQLSIEDLDIPLDLNLFKQTALHTNSDEFSTIAWTTLDDVRREFFGMINKWTEEKVREEALKYKTKIDFVTSNQSAYRAAKRLKILNKVCSHMETKIKFEKRTKEMCIEEAKKYNTRTDFAKENASLYNFACKNKWIDECCLHMESYYTNWTKETLKEHALKYNTRTEFRLNSPGAYKKAIEYGILDEVCSQMNVVRKSWNKNMIHQEALKYKTRSEFQKNSSAYQIAIKLGIMKEVCSHMKRKSRVVNQ